MQAVLRRRRRMTRVLCTVCVALLGQYRQIDEMIEAVPSPVPQQLDVGAFAELVDSLEVQCSEPDKRAIFTMIDRDGSGSICASELRQALRSSGAIKSMYDSSLRTFGTLIAATLAFDVGVFALKGSTAALDFLTAYAVEDSLSVDNLFVFLRSSERSISPLDGRRSLNSQIRPPVPRSCCAASSSSPASRR